MWIVAGDMVIVAVTVNPKIYYLIYGSSDHISVHGNDDFLIHSTLNNNAILA